MSRRAHDFYPTPAWATEVLLERWVIDRMPYVLEPCAGDGAIANVLKAHGIDVRTNDIDTSRDVDTYYDATAPNLWDKRPFYVVSNPPFSLASQIVPRAVESAIYGVAMLLRLSFLEPCEDRVVFLANHPPTRQLVLPRISFTGDGKTDNVTCAWFIWEPNARSSIEIVPKTARRVTDERALYVPESAEQAVMW